MSENYIFPFLWMRGEEEAVIRTEMEKIYDANIGAVCLEARPHPEFAGEKWWHDFDIVLDEAKKRNMKIWILDDAHFPTGQANGLLPEKYPDRAREFLYTQFVDVTGPTPFAALDVELLTKKQFTWMDFGKPQVKPVIDKNKIFSVTACKLVKGDIISDEMIDLSEYVNDGELIWSVPPGTWRVFVNFMSTDFGAKPEYINYIDKESVQVLIESVYEPHYQRYKDEFGKTIQGFFSDEPGFYNTDDLKMDDKIGEKIMPLPWCAELEEELERKLGEGWKIQIPYLWYHDREDLSYKLRFHYMDCVSRLYEKNFSSQLGNWCREHKVQYIGHVIEDNGEHSRLGCGAGHYFRAMLGQDMAGIDNIGNQILPGNPDSMRHSPSGLSDPEFYHFGLAKLGASSAQTDPKKKGRLLCENFGAYGWSLGVKNMKWLVDYLVMQGVNHFVPHAFSMSEFPDDDCPPHFYARGNNPQYPYFAELMKYTNCLCELFNNGKNVPQAAILYEGESDWMGKAMRTQVPGRVLTEHQIDYEILPADVFENQEYYGTCVEDGKLVVNERQMKVLIIPEVEYLPDTVVYFLMQNPELPVVFVNSRPKAIAWEEEKNGMECLLQYPVVPLSELAETLKKQGIYDVRLHKEDKNLGVYHYKKDKDIYFFFNTSLSETVKSKVTLPEAGEYGTYDAFQDKWYKLAHKDGTFELQLKPYESMILMIHPDHELEELLDRKNIEEIDISKEWELELCGAGTDKKAEVLKLAELLPVSMKYKDFSGTMQYTKTVKVEKDYDRIFFAPEYVYESMEVFVNGQSAGKKICPSYETDITELVNEGENEIVVKVVNTLVRSTNKTPGIFGPERSMLEPSGMFGAVKLIKVKANEI